MVIQQLLLAVLISHVLFVLFHSGFHSDIVLVFYAPGKVQEVPETRERFHQVTHRIRPNPDYTSYPASARCLQRTAETELLPVQPQHNFQTRTHPDKGNLIFEGTDLSDWW